MNLAPTQEDATPQRPYPKGNRKTPRPPHPKKAAPGIPKTAPHPRDRHAPCDDHWRL